MNRNKILAGISVVALVVFIGYVVSSAVNHDLSVSKTIDKMESLQIYGSGQHPDTTGHLGILSSSENQCVIDRQQKYFTIAFDYLDVPETNSKEYKAYRKVRDAGFKDVEYVANKFKLRKELEMAVRNKNLDQELPLTEIVFYHKRCDSTISAYRDVTLRDMFGIWQTISNAAYEYEVQLDSARAHEGYRKGVI